MEHDIEFIVTNPHKAFRKLATPLTFLAIFDALFMVIDVFWGTFLGTEALIAIGLINPILYLIRRLGTTLGIGTNSLISRFLGNKNYIGANNAFTQGIYLILIFGILIPVLSIPFLNFMLEAIDYSASFKLVRLYFYPLGVFAFIFLFAEFFSETLQSEGDSKKITKYNIIGNLINFILSPILCFIFNLGVVGLSLGTVCGALFTAVMLANIYFIKTSTVVKFIFQQFKFKINILKEIFKVTIPNFLDRSLYSFLAIFINGALCVIIGPEAIAIYTIYDKILDFLIAPVSGSSRGLISVSGHLYGAGKIKKIKSLFYYGLKINLVLSLITIAIFTICHLLISKCYELGILTYYANTLGVFEFNLIFIILVIISFCYIIDYAVYKILDGMGKSFYSLMGSLLLIVITVISIIGFYLIFHNAYAIIFGIAIPNFLQVIYYFIIIHWIFKTEEKKINT